MPDLITHLRPHIIAQIGEVEAAEGGLKHWVLSGSYHVKTLTPELTVLENISIKQISPYLLHDYIRFCFSGIETLSSARQEFLHQKNASWPAIKAYYSGYFSAHAIMRACGAGVSHLTGKEFKHLSQVYDAYNPDAVIPEYREFPTDINFQLSQSESDHTNYTLTIKRSRAGNGVHDKFWRDFAGFLDYASTKSASLGHPNHQEFIADIVRVKNALELSGGGNSENGGPSWQSKIRNEINYQHLYGVWHPIDKRISIDKVFAGLSSMESCAVSMDEDRTLKTLVAFVNNSSFLANLNKEIAEYLATFKTSRKTFGYKLAQLMHKI